MCAYIPVCTHNNERHNDQKKDSHHYSNYHHYVSNTMLMTSGLCILIIHVPDTITVVMMFPSATISRNVDNNYSQCEDCIYR